MYDSYQSGQQLSIRPAAINNVNSYQLGLQQFYLTSSHFVFMCVCVCLCMNIPWSQVGCCAVWFSVSLLGIIRVAVAVCRVCPPAASCMMSWSVHVYWGVLFCCVDVREGVRVGHDTSASMRRQEWGWLDRDAGSPCKVQ